METIVEPLSKESIIEYQQIYKEEFGEEISFEEAKAQGIKLLRLFDIIYKPILIEER